MPTTTNDSRLLYICFEVDKDLKKYMSRLENCCTTDFGNLDCMYGCPRFSRQNLPVQLASTDAVSPSPKNNGGGGGGIQFILLHCF